MTKIILPLFTIPDGQSIIGPFLVPISIQSAKVEIDTTNLLNQGVLITLGIEVSYDGGQSWQSVSQAQRPGGIAFGDNNEIINSLDVSGAIGQPQNLTRRIRGIIKSVGGSFISAGGALDLE